MKLMNGMRVRLIGDVAPYPLGLFPAGTCGTVVHVGKMYTPGMHIALVRLDKRFESLDDWDNELQVFLGEDGEITEACFEACPDRMTGLCGGLRTVHGACLGSERGLVNTFPTAKMDYYDCLEGVRFWLRCIDFRDVREAGPADVLRWAKLADECLMEAIGFASVRWEG